MEENISVVVRVRPLQPHEQKRGDTSCVTAGSSFKEIQIHTGPQEAQSYACNRFFPSSTTQEEFFTESGVPGLLDSVIGGFHACSFAFGQTGAGKTYTCTGPSQSIRLNSEDDGMMGRSLQYLFQKLNNLGVSFKVKMSCMEIYHESVFDLTLPEQSKVSLPVREHPQKGFFADGCKKNDIRNVNEAVRLLDHAIKLRHTGSHEMNARSNRSHFLTELCLELSGNSVDAAKQKKGASQIFGDLKSQLDGDQDFDILGKMTFVDLAGSERLKNTKSSGQMAHDTGFINKSLYVLGKVIAGLVRGASENNIEVPFRESKLTKLLIGSLGGQCRTLLISCVSEATSSMYETLRTLKFSMTAAKIKNRPVRFLDPQEKLILDLRDEIKRLKEENKFLIVSLMANPPQPSTSAGKNGDVYMMPPAVVGNEPTPAGLKKSNTTRAALAPSDTAALYFNHQQMSHSHGAGYNSAVSSEIYSGNNMNAYADNSHQHNHISRQVPRNPRSGGRIQALQKINSTKGKPFKKKKPSPYLLGNTPEAQDLYLAMRTGTGKAKHLPSVSSHTHNSNSSEGYSPRFSYQQMPHMGEQQQLQPVQSDNPLKSLKDKLAILKFELDEKRQYMEDNPGTVTDAHEAQLLELEKEVREMHMELKAVASLEGLSINKMPHSGAVVFPLGDPSLPIKFDKEKPDIDVYSALNMGNRKVYDSTPSSKKSAALAPLPVGAAQIDIDAQQQSYISRKLHLDAYINGKKRLSSLPPKQKPPPASSESETDTTVKAPLKGFNSSQARGLKIGKAAEARHVAKGPVPVTHKQPLGSMKPSPKVDSKISSPHALIDSSLPIHSRLKKEVAPKIFIAKIGNEDDDSVFGINSAFSAKFENILTNISSPVSPVYGQDPPPRSFKRADIERGNMSPPIASALKPIAAEAQVEDWRAHSTASPDNNFDDRENDCVGNSSSNERHASRGKEEGEGVGDPMTHSIKSRNNNFDDHKNDHDHSVGSSSSSRKHHDSKREDPEEGQPEQNGDGDEYTDDAFEEAYDDDDFEDADS